MVSREVGESEARGQDGEVRVEEKAWEK